MNCELTIELLTSSSEVLRQVMMPETRFSKMMTFMARTRSTQTWIWSCCFPMEWMKCVTWLKAIGLMRSRIFIFMVGFHIVSRVETKCGRRAKSSPLAGDTVGWWLVGEVASFSWNNKTTHTHKSLLHLRRRQTHSLIHSKIKLTRPTPVTPRSWGMMRGGTNLVTCTNWKKNTD